MTVAELVKKYQDYLPAQGVHDLAHTALSPRPVVSESEQEYALHIKLRPGIGRTRTRHRVPPRKPSTSDFEQGYAANVAPRYVPRFRKSGNNPNISRIPAPIGVAFESHESSRLPSPEKRPSHISRDGHQSRPPSPYADKPVPSSLKFTKQRVVSRSRDKPSSRTPTTPANKSTFRRPTSTKVSTIARHYERLGRETERSRSRYAVIRSRPPRPVVFARAKVEVLDSVKDAIADDSESSDPSSEADDEDEDEGNDEERCVAPSLKRQLPPPTADASDSAPIQPKDPIPEVLPSPSQVSDAQAQDNEAPTRLAPPGQITLPSSPLLKAANSKSDLTLTPPTSEIDSTERNSILKALSGFWQQPARSSIEVDDPTNDPEHIFRDSSMVVRLDEPTSIIALALK